MVAYKIWYVVQTQAGKEDLACEHLRRQGFETFLPRLRARKAMRRGKYKTVLRPLFPGYVFVSFDAATVRWQAINSTIGVLRLVGFGEGPARLEPGLVERLDELSADGYVTFRDELQPADRVRILSGPFDDWIGQVVHLSEGNRAIVLLQMASRGVKIEIARDSLMKAA